MSWHVLVAEPAILGVLFVGMVLHVALSAGLFALVFRRFPEATDLRFPSYLVVLPILWVGSIVTSYCNVVVAVMADARLRGEEPTVADGMALATRKLDRILSWTVLAMAVGLVLQLVAERFKLGGVIARRLLGLAWGLATTFVIPVLALEDVGVRDAVTRSAGLFKAKWGETVAAQGGLGVAVFLVMLPVTLVAMLLLAISVPLGVIALAVSFVGLAIVCGALDAVVDVALYRYAIDGAVLGAFTTEDLDGAFSPRRRGR